jgi:tripartite-type tricarboxylate transporter receptor subunit TctC
LGHDITMGVYYPVIAPKNLPADVKAKLFKAAKAAIETQAFTAQAVERGYNLDIKDPEDFRKELWNDYRANEVLVRELGMAKK